MTGLEQVGIYTQRRTNNRLDRSTSTLTMVKIYLHDGDLQHNSEIFRFNADILVGSPRT